MSVLNQVTKFFKNILGIKSDSMDLRDLRIDESGKTQRDRDRASYSTRSRDSRGSSGGGNYRQGGRNTSRSGGDSRHSRGERSGPSSGNYRSSSSHSRDRSPSSSSSGNYRGDRDRNNHRNYRDHQRSGAPRQDQRNWRDRDSGGNSAQRPESRPENETRSSQRPPVSSASSAPKEERKFLLGTVTNYLPNITVAIVKVQKGAIQVNDMLAFEGEQTKFRQKITSMQMDHDPVKLARVGQEVGMKVDQEVRAGDQVFRVG